jgi:hypothetical protein
MTEHKAARFAAGRFQCSRDPKAGRHSIDLIFGSPPQKFESSPDPKAVCHPAEAAQAGRSPQFQSSPGPKAGCPTPGMRRLPGKSFSKGRPLPWFLGTATRHDDSTGDFKFLSGQPLVEKHLSVDRPEFHIQAKMKRVRVGIERWHKSGKDPSAVGKLMEGARPLANAGKLTSWRNSWTKRWRCWARPRKCPT